jgi:hypothetical protein
VESVCSGVTNETEILERLERANSEQISHEVIGTDPVRVRIENETPNSRSDRTTHLVVVGNDWIVSSSPDYLYRGLSDSASSSKEYRDADGSDGVRESNTVRFPDKYMLYLGVQDESPLLRERVRSVVDVVDWDDETPGPAESTESGLTSNGIAGSAQDSDERDDAQDPFQDFVDSLVH